MSRHAHALGPAQGARIARAAAVLYVVLLVALPLAVLVAVAVASGVDALVADVTAPVARSALALTIWTALLVGVINAVLGTATAWALARHRWPGTQLLSAAVDLPFAIPTLVTGVMLAVLYGPEAVLGERLSALGIEVVFAPPGIVLALLFVTFPFVVRAVEPVLVELDVAEEEAAIVLGAGPVRVFSTVALPAILPAAASGAVRSVARALGEFGSIVVVAGNVPFETLTAPVHVFGAIESGDRAAASAVSVVLLALALTLHAAAFALERRKGAARAG
jgi:sulfate transport system permease protein